MHENRDVRFWHLADMLFTLANVCFWVESGNGLWARLLNNFTPGWSCLLDVD